SNRRGFGRFARQVIKALAEAGSRHEFSVFIDRPSVDEVEVPATFRTVVVDVREAPSKAASARGRRGLGDLLAMGRAVAREGPESDSVLRRHGLLPREKFLLYVGGLSPHKNLPRLIEAFALAASSDVRLVLVGDTGDVFHTHVPALRQAVARLQLGDRVLFTG